MRLIDADALKETIKNQHWKADTQMELTLKWIDMLINEAPTIETPRDWTPCAEGMPGDCKPCYVTAIKTEEDGSRHEYVVEGYFAKGVWFDKGGWKINSKGVYPWDCVAVAWKYNIVPAPYRADDTTGKVKEDAEC